MDKSEAILNYSDPDKVVSLANGYFGKNIPIYLSTRKDKKYMLQDPNNKWVHFGQMGYEDFTYHRDEARKQRYLARATNIKGNWKNDKYSPNNLSIHLLWT